MASYLAALGFTLVVEAPLYYILLTVVFEATPVRALSAAIGVNLISHPVGFLVLAPALATLTPWWGSLSIVEAWAVLVEASIIWRIWGGIWYSLGISFAANATSFALASLAFRWMWPT